MTVYEQLSSDIRETLAAFHPKHDETPLSIDITVTSIMRLIDLAITEHVEGWPCPATETRQNASNRA